MVICLERVADLHMSQRMPLPLTVSDFSKIQIGFTFLVPVHPGSPEKGLLNGCVCVYSKSQQPDKSSHSSLITNRATGEGNAIGRVHPSISTLAFAPNGL